MASSALHYDDIYSISSFDNVRINALNALLGYAKATYSSKVLLLDGSIREEDDGEIRLLFLEDWRLVLMILTLTLFGLY